jgi:hypothetical protein
MSYKNEDMIVNRDRGYEMNLDNIVNDLYKKKEIEEKFNDKNILKMLEDEYEDLLDDSIGFGL